MSGILKLNDLFNDDETNLRDVMLKAIKMDRQLTCSLIIEHGRFVVAKSNFKFSGRRTNILQITPIANGQINHIPGRARQVLPNGVSAASHRALKIRALD